ncbi:8961_t:CDS:2, partial [Gigaspora rosea]
FCDLDTNEITDAPCNNTNSAIATSTVNSSNKKGKQREDCNIPANNLRKPSYSSPALTAMTFSNHLLIQQRNQRRAILTACL